MCGRSVFEVSGGIVSAMFGSVDDGIVGGVERSRCAGCIGGRAGCADGRTDFSASLWVKDHG